MSVYKSSAKICVKFGGDSRLVNVGFSTKIQGSSGKSVSPTVFPNCLKASVEGFTLIISDRNESGRGSEPGPGGRAFSLVHLVSSQCMMRESVNLPEQDRDSKLKRDSEPGSKRPVEAHPGCLFATPNTYWPGPPLPSCPLSRTGPGSMEVWEVVMTTTPSYPVALTGQNGRRGRRRAIKDKVHFPSSSFLKIRGCHPLHHKNPENVPREGCEESPRCLIPYPAPGGGGYLR